MLYVEEDKILSSIVPVEAVKPLNLFIFKNENSAVILDKSTSFLDIIILNVAFLHLVLWH